MAVIESIIIVSRIITTNSCRTSFIQFAQTVCHHNRSHEWTITSQFRNPNPSSSSPRTSSYVFDLATKQINSQHQIHKRWCLMTIAMYRTSWIEEDRRRRRRQQRLICVASSSAITSETPFYRRKRAACAAMRTDWGLRRRSSLLALTAMNDGSWGTGANKQ